MSINLPDTLAVAGPVPAVAPQIGSTLVSASTISPTVEQHPVSGTATINTINLPISGYKGVLVLTSLGGFTLGTAGNIGISSSINVPTGSAVELWYDGTKWRPTGSNTTPYWTVGANITAANTISLTNTIHHIVHSGVIIENINPPPGFTAGEVVLMADPADSAQQNGFTLGFLGNTAQLNAYTYCPGGQSLTLYYDGSIWWIQDIPGTLVWTLQGDANFTWTEDTFRVVLLGSTLTASRTVTLPDVSEWAFKTLTWKDAAAGVSEHFPMVFQPTTGQGLDTGNGSAVVNGTLKVTVPGSTVQFYSNGGDWFLISPQQATGALPGGQSSQSQGDADITLTAASAPVTFATTHFSALRTVHLPTPISMAGKVITWADTNHAVNGSNGVQFLCSSGNIEFINGSTGIANYNPSRIFQFYSTGEDWRVLSINSVTGNNTQVINWTAINDSSTSISPITNGVYTSASWTHTNTFQLPPSNIYLQSNFYVVDTGLISATNSLSIVPSSGDSIDHNSSGMVLDVPWSSVTFVAYKSGHWRVVASTTKHISPVPDSSTAIGQLFDTNSQLSTVGANLMQWNNQGFPQLGLTAQRNIGIGGTNSFFKSLLSGNSVGLLSPSESAYVIADESAGTVIGSTVNSYLRVDSNKTTVNAGAANSTTSTLLSVKPQNTQNAVGATAIQVNTGGSASAGFGASSGQAGVYCDWRQRTVNSLGTGTTVNRLVAVSGNNAIDIPAATANLITIVGVALDTASPSGAVRVADSGDVFVEYDGTVNANDSLVSSGTTAGRVMANNRPPPGALIGKALEAGGTTVAGQVRMMFQWGSGGAGIGQFVSVSDANYTTSAADGLISYSSLTASRTVTLSAASKAKGSLTSQWVVSVIDLGNNIINSSRNITITDGGSFTVTINMTGGQAAVASDGVNWHLLYLTPTVTITTPTLASVYNAGSSAADETMVVGASSRPPPVVKANSAGVGSLFQAQTSLAAILMDINDNGTQKIVSGVADSSSAIGTLFDTVNTLSTAGAKLMQWDNAGVGQVSLSIGRNATGTSALNFYFQPMVSGTGVGLLSQSGAGVIVTDDTVGTTVLYGTSYLRIVSNALVVSAIGDSASSVLLDIQPMNTQQTAGATAIRAATGGGLYAGFAAASGVTGVYCDWRERIVKAGGAGTTVNRLVAANGNNTVDIPTATANLTSIIGVALDSSAAGVGVRVADSGDVFVEYDGTVNTNDLLVSSGTTAGRVQTNNNPPIGSLIGKALEAGGTTIAGQVRMAFQLGGGGGSQYKFSFADAFNSSSFTPVATTTGSIIVGQRLSFRNAGKVFSGTKFYWMDGASAGSRTVTCDLWGPTGTNLSTGTVTVNTAGEYTCTMSNYTILSTDIYKVLTLTVYDSTSYTNVPVATWNAGVPGLTGMYGQSIMDGVFVISGVTGSGHSAPSTIDSANFYPIDPIVGT